MSDIKAMEEYSLAGKTLLVVDDEVDLRDILASELEFSGARVYRAENIQAAQKILKDNTIDLVISDIRMPGGTGIDLLDFIKAKDVDIPPIILITGFADISPEDAFNKGAEVLMNKPFRLDDLIKTVYRYCHPIEDRFNEEEQVKKQIDWDFSSSLEQKIKSGECKIGRGGMSLVLDNQEKKIENGDVIKFKLSFSDVKFDGTAVCRWYKPSDKNKYSFVGLEFLNLDQSTLNYLLKYWKDHDKIVPFIPA